MNRQLNRFPIYALKLLYSVADTGFPRGGGANSPGGAPTYDFAKFSQKLHEIERIWTPAGGGCASKILLCRSATDTSRNNEAKFPCALDTFQSGNVLIILCNNLFMTTESNSIFLLHSSLICAAYCTFSNFMEDGIRLF